MHNHIADVLNGRRRWCVVTGDAAEIMPTLDEGCADAVVTDAPFVTASRRKGKARVRVIEESGVRR